MRRVNDTCLERLAPRECGDCRTQWELALSPLQLVYPGFSAWVRMTVAPGIEEGSRRVFTSYSDGRLSGVVIAKAADEHKLCTIWIAPHARRSGLAFELVSEAIDWMGVSRPLLTVPEERILDFVPLISRLSFELVETKFSYYRPGKREYVFNGELV